MTTLPTILLMGPLAAMLLDRKARYQEVLIPVFCSIASVPREAVFDYNGVPPVKW
jgi:hypothetical protein